MIPILKISVFFLLAFSFNSDIYTHSVPKIEGGTQSLAAYSGKKILIITLPIVQDASADSLLYALDTLATAHQNEIAVIGVPSYEDGFTVAQKTTLQQWYRSKLSNSILITDGLYSRRTSGEQQHALFQWLTKVSNNTYFDVDVTGSGFQFFINGNGELYGVLRPGTSVWSKAVNKVLKHQ